MLALITNNGTHSPEKWASSLLDDLVPTPHDCSLVGLIKIAAAKDKLRPHVVEMIAQIRNTEVKAYTTLNNDETHAFAYSYNFNHGVVSDGPYFQFLHNESRKVRSGWDWADQFVQKVCRAATEIEGHIPTNAMVDEVYNILSHWLNSVLACERSHYVSHNHLQAIGV